ncbi:glycosyltransferase family 2 protein [uncultured Hymenobacter sp.]|uniref:glycosyltransferase family 2 protein n=1 Tax=uncultured Hymenobacter sp. TaxID=170016 RepID=UPI0035CC7DB3
MLETIDKAGEIIEEEKAGGITNVPVFLTICIPTYNRATILDTVIAITPQLTENVSIKIFDNCSDIPVSTILKGHLTDKIHIVRNSANVGVSGNIIKCFEHCDTDWMWLLSDDDAPASDAISTILATIAKHPHVSVIKYSSNTGSLEHNVKEEVIATGQKDFISKITNFSNLLFISSTVCKVSEMRKLVKDAYYFTQGLAPHLVFIFSYLAANPTAKVLFSPLSIVSLRRWDTPGHATWNEMLVYKSLADIIHVVKDTEERKMLFNKIDSYGHFYKGPFASSNLKAVIKAIILAKDDKQEHNMVAEYLSTSVFTYWAENASTRSFLLRSATISFLIAFLHSPFVNTAAKFFIRTRPSKRIFYYNRYFLFNKDYRL